MFWAVEKFPAILGFSISKQDDDDDDDTTTLQYICAMMDNVLLHMHFKLHYCAQMYLDE